MKNNNKKGSALVVALIIFGIIVITSLSVALTTVRQIKTSMQASKTNISYQNADEGVDKVMTAIIRGAKDVEIDGKISVLTVMGATGNLPNGSKCDTADGLIKSTDSSGNFTAPPRFSVKLLTHLGATIRCDGLEDISEIIRLESSGNDNATGTQRIVGANVQQKDSKIKLLLHFDKANAGSTFLESSRVHHKVENTNNVGVGVTGALPFSTSNYGVAFFDGSDDYLLIQDQLNDWKIGSALDKAPFAVDFWAHFNGDNASGAERTFFQMMDGSGTNFLKIKYAIDSPHLITIETSGGSCTYNNATWDGDYDPNSWIHFAFVRERNNEVKLYIGGGARSSLIGTCDYSGESFSLSKIYIGSDSSGGNNFYGFMDEFRFFAGEFWVEDSFQPGTMPY